MVKYIPIMFVLFLCLSCHKGDKDDFYGRWRWTYSEVGGMVSKVDTIYYNFDNHIICIQNQGRQGKFDAIFGEYMTIRDSLYFEFVTLNPISRESFKVLKISSEEMILKNKISTKYFRKF